MSGGTGGLSAGINANDMNSLEEQRRRAFFVGDCWRFFWFLASILFAAGALYLVHYFWIKLGIFTARPNFSQLAILPGFAAAYAALIFAVLRFESWREKESVLESYIFYSNSLSWGVVGGLFIAAICFFLLLPVEIFVFKSTFLGALIYALIKGFVAGAVSGIMAFVSEIFC